MMKVVIGSMVLCHLLVTGEVSQTNNENQPIVKLLGQVTDIQKGSRYIEQVDKKQALRADRDILIIKGQNRPGLYQVDAKACMLVRDETPEEREARLFPKTKVVEESKSEPSLPRGEEVKEEPVIDANKAGIEIQDRPAIDDQDSTPMDEMKKDLNEVKEELKNLNLSSKEEIKPEPQDPVAKPEVIQPKVEKKAEPVAPQKSEPKVEESKEKSNKSLLDYIR